jgi:alpha,alpha-trehalose phosphorylase
MDLADLAGNVSDGIHIASCGGVWMAIVDGFAGLRDEDGGDLRFTARLPVDWTRLRFRLIVRGHRLEVEMTTDRTTYRLLDGSGHSVVSSGETLVLEPGKPVSVTAADPAEAAVGN